MFSGFSATNHSRYTTDAETEAFRVGGGDIRPAQEMILHVQQTMERIETANYLDLARHSRKLIEDEPTGPPENNHRFSNLSKSCVDVTYIGQ